MTIGNEPARLALAEEFEASRMRLTRIAYGMLGSLSEAEDAVQEAWLRLDRSGAVDATGLAITDVRAWLTTVVGRICLDLLRARAARREQQVGTWLPEPVVEIETVDGDPEVQTVLADTVGLALLVVLEQLSPPERLAFVLHDVFAMPFDEIAPIVGRTPQAARQLASRARRRVQAAPTPDKDLARQRKVVDAFLEAARNGDMRALLEVLDPEVVFRADVGPLGRRKPVLGARAVAERVLVTAPRFVGGLIPAIVNGQAGAVSVSRGDVSVVGFTVVGDRITAIDIIADPAKLRRVPR